MPRYRNSFKNGVKNSLVFVTRQGAETCRLPTATTFKLLIEQLKSVKDFPPVFASEDQDNQLSHDFALVTG